eukprot:Platyproteum_vivax@DN8469_c0_g1_i1.p1
MKLFSAVVLSLLFCFVKSFKSRAIRGHLKNVSAHGQAMRVRSHAIEFGTEISDLSAKMDTLKEKVDDPNADATLDDTEAMWKEVMWADSEFADLCEKVKKMEESPEKGELESRLTGLESTMGHIQDKLDEKFLEKYTHEVAEINKELSGKKEELKRLLWLSLNDEVKKAQKAAMELLAKLEENYSKTTENY